MTVQIHLNIHFFLIQYQMINYKWNELYSDLHSGKFYPILKKFLLNFDRLSPNLMYKIRDSLDRKLFTSL